ncbi:MAG: N-acetylmuramoyl-L-alanine amidase [Rhizobiaceae bacterium]
MTFAPDEVTAHVRASPNFGERKGVTAPDMIVLHYTGMESGVAAENWLRNPASEVSSHYLVHEDGLVVQMVPESARAWHAGAGSWQGVADINSRSVGIEIVNGGHAFGSPAFPARQIDAVIALCRGIALRHGIAPERILGHSDVSPGRKTDPGEKFPWDRLHAEAVGHWVSPSPLRRGPRLSLGSHGKAVEALTASLAAYGYGITVGNEYDEAIQTIVAAFQRHFRPVLVDGVADQSTIDTLHALIAARTRS